MDDEDELREINLSSRPRREERRKQRERDRANRQLSRAKEEMEERRREEKGDGGGENGGGGGGGSGGGGGGSRRGGDGGAAGYVSGRMTPGGAGMQRGVGSERGAFFGSVTYFQETKTRLGRIPNRDLLHESDQQQRQYLAQAARQQRMAELYTKFGDRASRERWGAGVNGSGGGGQQREEGRERSR